MQYISKTYIEVLEIVIPYLNGIENLQQFCKEHNLNYYTIIRIKNGISNKLYPKLLYKLLLIMDYDASYNIVHEYKIIKKKLAKYN